MSETASAVLRPDLCVIGAGSGGLSVAAAAAQFGVPVVLIERGRMGGDCLNYGCVPSKALLAAAKHARQMRQASAFGMEPVSPRIDFGRVHDHVHRVIADIAPNDSAERFTGLGVTVLRGEACFTDKRTVGVGDIKIKARRFVIATGSSPAIPDIPGLEDVRYFTNETIFDVNEPIGHLIVVGAGPIGIELAQAYGRLGAKVTVIDQNEALAHLDPEAARAVLRCLDREGVVLHTGTDIARVERTPGGVRIFVRKSQQAGKQRPDEKPLDSEDSIDGTHLLLAAGRIPNIDGLGLKAARIRTHDYGIKVNRHLKTRNGRVYVIGDCIGPPHFTHLAARHAEMVVKNALFRLRPTLDFAQIPRALYTDPEIAEIGLGEEEARRRYRKIRIERWPYADNDRAEAERETEGFIKLIASKRGHLLGCVIVGANAGELISLWILAVAKKMKVADIVGLVLPYPTLSEIGKRAALSYYRALPQKPYIRRVIAFLRKLG